MWWCYCGHSQARRTRRSGNQNEHSSGSRNRRNNRTTNRCERKNKKGIKSTLRLLVGQRTTVCCYLLCVCLSVCMTKDAILPSAKRKATCSGTSIVAPRYSRISGREILPSRLRGEKQPCQTSRRESLSSRLRGGKQPCRTPGRF